MTRIKELIKYKKIVKVIRPLNFVYDRTRFKGDTDYLIDWLNNIGIKSIDITSNNKVSNILIISILGSNNNHTMYCMSLLMTPHAIIDETFLELLKSEADKYRAIPVLLTYDDITGSNGVVANMLKVQVITASQIEGINNLMMNNKLPNIKGESTLLTHKIVHYARIKLAKIN